MRYILLVILLALAVVLALHYGRSGKTNQVEEASAILDKTKAALLPSQLQQVEVALDAFANERNAYPDDLVELVPGYLGAADLLVDPWGTRLRLEKSVGKNAVLVSAGPDRAFASSDDIRRSL